MKRIVLTLALAIIASFLVFSQSYPFKYQTVLRDNSGNMLTNKNVGLRISIMQGATPAMVYREEFNLTSDEFAILDIEIGTGTVLNGNYLIIDWSAQNSHLSIEIDMSGGTTYTLLGTAPILAAPVANYAHKAGGATFPAGLIMPFGGPIAKIPDGWLLCDGTAVSRTEYVELFDAIGISWGAGNLTTTFNLPDLRGQFLRGVDYTAGVDPDKATRTAKYTGGNTGNNVGSFQTDELKQHQHNIPYYLYDGSQFATVSSNRPLVSSTGTRHEIHSGQKTVNTGGSESRAKNAYVNYIIKY